MNRLESARPDQRQHSDGPRWAWIITLVVISLLFLTVTSVGEFSGPRVAGIGLLLQSHG